jgi:dipeptidyl aminopeptidase/acylaminoacyl peptidase
MQGGHPRPQIQARTLRKSAAIVLAAVFSASASPSVAGSAAGHGRAATFRGLVSLSSPAISPDGKRAVVIATRANFKENKYERDLDIYDIATHDHRTLTYKREALSDPAWSPDGKRLAFIANDGTGDDAKAQIFVMPLDGGDPRPITHDMGGVDQFTWRPDGDAIAYAAEQPKPKREGEDKYRDAFVFTTEPITQREPDLPVHLFVVDANGGKAHQLTRGPRSVTEGEAESTISWSADGKSIAFVLAPNAILNDAVQGHIDVVDVASEKLSELTTNGGFESSPLFSPDGKHIAYQHSAGDNQVNRNDLYLTAPGAGNGADLSSAFDRQVHDAFWAADSQALYFTCANHTTLQLVKLPLDGKPAAVELDGGVNVTSVDHATASDGGMVFVGTTSASPDELYYLSPEGKADRLSDYNAAIRAQSLGRASTVEFPTTTGVTGDGVLLFPPGYVAGRKYPLVLYIHGGPTSSSALDFDTFGQSLAAHGWLVLEPNYRGSDNLGITYQRSVLYDADEGPGKDIMAAVNAVEALGIVDTHRIAVSGWSYGGIMTAWMISKYHIWRAAVSGASVNDWATDYGVADDSESDEALFHNSPYVRNRYASEWKRVSAITYAPDVTTPVLIVSDVGDNRDPFATSSMYYRALRDNHKAATFVAYPVDGHFPHDPIRREDVIARFGDYIASHFR